MNSPAPRKPLQTNICLQVTGFDLNHPAGPVAKGIVVSHPFMEGEEVSVRLRTREDAEATYMATAAAKGSLDKYFKQRPSVENFANGYKVGRNVIAPMEPGHLLMCQGAIKDWDAMPAGSTERVWKAQWMDNFTRTPESVALYGAGKVDVRTHEASGRTFASLDLLKVAESVEINSLEDAVKFYADYMEPTTTVGAGSLNVENIATSPIANFRLRNESTQEAWSCFVYNQSVKKNTFDKDGNPITINVPGDMTDSFQAAFVRGEQSSGKLRLLGAAMDDNLFSLLEDERDIQHATQLRESLQAGRLKLEAIPGLRIPIVGASLDDLLAEGGNGQKRSQLNRAWEESCMPITGRDGQRQMVPGYIPMIVGVLPGSSRAPSEPRGVILSSFVNDENARARSMNMLRTSQWVPQFTQERERVQQQRNEQAAERGGEMRGPEPHAPEREPAMEGASAAAERDNAYSRARDGYDDSPSPH